MILHSFIEYLKYRWKAMGRHGTHSPFVYDLIEQVVLNKDVIDREYIVSCPKLALEYENLISRIAAHYKYLEIQRMPVEGDPVKQYADMLLLGSAKPLQWVAMMNEYSYLLRNNSAVIAVDIHSSPEHSKGWQQLCADPMVRMSIDLYGIGVLFFKKEFKATQHFVLKY